MHGAALEKIACPLNIQDHSLVVRLRLFGMGKRTDQALLVEGSSKLAARASPTDTHNAAKSLRASRKRSGGLNAPEDDVIHERTKEASAKTPNVSAMRPQKKLRTESRTKVLEVGRHTISKLEGIGGRAHTKDRQSAKSKAQSTVSNNGVIYPLGDTAQALGSPGQMSAEEATEILERPASGAGRRGKTTRAKAPIVEADGTTESPTEGVTKPKKEKDHGKKPLNDPMTDGSGGNAEGSNYSHRKSSSEAVQSNSISSEWPSGASMRRRGKEAELQSTANDPDNGGWIAKGAVEIIGRSQDSDDEDDNDHTAVLLNALDTSGKDRLSGHSSNETFTHEDQTSSFSNSNRIEKQLPAMKPSTGPGVVYVGRIPHGFHEHQLRSYFSQFGKITRLRLSRSRRTGKSRHFAFIEFAEKEVANIVAGTMDNYLLFGHILKCKLVPGDNLHENIWKGANKRFKSVPWNSLEGRKLNLPKDKTKWQSKISSEQKKREKAVEKMKSIGYEFELPTLRGVDEI